MDLKLWPDGDDPWGAVWESASAPPTSRVDPHAREQLAARLQGMHARLQGHGVPPSTESVLQALHDRLTTLGLRKR